MAAADERGARRAAWGHTGGIPYGRSTCEVDSDYPPRGLPWGEIRMAPLRGTRRRTAERGMAEVPVGAATFLLSDVEGSIRLWEQYPEAMKHALARHDALLREAIQAHGGRVFKTVGDAFYAVFTNAPDALRAAIAGQRALHAEPWG